MSNDERMIRVENACMEQATRIEALEKRTYNLPKTDAYNRLEQRIEAQQAQINKLDQALANRDTELIMLRKKHNALCDALKMYMDSVNCDDFRGGSYMLGQAHKLLDNARIDTGDTDRPRSYEVGSGEDIPQEVQGVSKTEQLGEIDGVTPRRNGSGDNRNSDSVDSNLDLGVDEQLKDIRERWLQAFDATPSGTGFDERLWRKLDVILRPIIERLVKRAERAYTERNRVVSAFARCAILCGHKAFVMPHKADDEDWGEWQNVVCIEFGRYGQFTWHIHDSQLPIFEHLRRIDNNVWDGHDTEDKYRRLQALAEGKE